MGSFTLCVLVASAATILSQASARPDRDALKIVSVLEGKDTLKAFLKTFPEVQYQVLGKSDPDFPNSVLGLPGQLKVKGVIRGRQAIADFTGKNDVPVRIPASMQRQPIPVNVVPNTRTKSPKAPGKNRTPITIQQLQELMESVSDVANPFAAESPPLTPEELFKKQLEEWNSGLRSTPPVAWLMPKVTTPPSSPRNPLAGQQPPPQEESSGDVPQMESTYQELVYWKRKQKQEQAGQVDGKQEQASKVDGKQEQASKVDGKQEQASQVDGKAELTPRPAPA